MLLHILQTAQAGVLHRAGIGFALAGQHIEQAALAAAVMAQQADAIAQFYGKGKVLEQRPWPASSCRDCAEIRVVMLLLSFFGT